MITVSTKRIFPLKTIVVCCGLASATAAWGSPPSNKKSLTTDVLQTKGELSDWAGVYQTKTRWWGTYFTPLVVAADGSVDLAGTRLEFTYADGVLEFDWQAIRNTKAKGRLQFKAGAAGKSFNGAIHPRRQDGPVEFSGRQFTDFKKAYLLARKTLMAEFFDPFVTTDLRNEVGWAGDDEKAAGVLEGLKKEVTSQSGYYGDPWEAKWFISVRDPIAKTRLFAFLQKMPKGAILHVHPTAMGDYTALLEDARTYTKDGKRFYVSQDYREHEPPNTLFVFDENAPSGYTLLADAWNNHRNEVLATVVLTVEDQDYQGDVWELFQPVFARISPLLHESELERRYYRRAFQYLVEKDNISHVELRMAWRPENEGQPGTNENTILNALKGLDLTMKAVWSDSRSIRAKSSNDDYDRAIIDDIVKVGRNMSEQPSGRLIGYDLVGEEDTGRTTFYYLDDLVTAYGRLGNFLPPMFFHDGESDLPPDYADAAALLAGTPSEDWFNNNLVDAYLMNTLVLPGFAFMTARVGHGLELFKTPGLARRFKEAGICVELCPVSNQLLRYIADIREHPGQQYLAAGIRVSLNPDDPAIYGYQGVTHDFWEACIAWNLDLLALKVLSYYSLKHSGLPRAEKAKAIQEWRREWATFAAQSERFTVGQ